MDLVGVDVGLDVARSFYEQSFGEPRWRPSPIAVKTVAAGRTGRKSGRGYYDYPGRFLSRPRPRAAARRRRRRADRDRRLTHRWRCELQAAAQDAGWEVARPGEAGTRAP